MSESKVVKAHEWDSNEIKYSDIKKNAQGGKSLYINSNSTGGGITLQTPLMKCPFGIKSYDDEGSKYTLELSFGDITSATNELNKLFHDNMTKLDEKLLNDGVVNSLPWFSKKEMSKEVLRELYNQMVKVSKDKETGEPNGKYPPTFRIKIPFYNESWDQVKVFDENRNRITDDLRDVLTSGCQVKALIQCCGVWMVSGKYGCTWKAKQLIVRRAENFNDYAFISDDEDEVIEESLENEFRNNSELLIDDDDEDDDDDDDDDDENEDGDDGDSPPKITLKKTRKPRAKKN